MKQHILLLLALAVSHESALILDVLKHMAWLLLFSSPYSINKYTSFFGSSQNNRLFLTLLPPECNCQIKILEEQNVMLSSDNLIIKGTILTAVSTMSLLHLFKG